MKKRRIYYSLVMAVMLLLSACSASKNSTEAQYDRGTGQSGANQAGSGNGFTADTSAETTASTEEPKSSAGEAANNSDTNRKRIRKISLILETVEFDGSLKVITEEIQKSGGYVESSSINGSSTEYKGSRSAQYVLRIPADKADSFIKIMGNKMSLIHEEESSEDITLNYVDVQSKVKALEIEQERLLALLEKANKIEDIIALEERLSDVRYQVEQNTSTLRTYDNLVEYATITLNVDEVLRISPVENKGPGSRMKTGLTNSLFNIRDGFVETAVWFVANLPYIIFWGIVIGLSIFITMKVYHKKEKRQLSGPGQNTNAGKKEEGELKK